MQVLGQENAVHERPELCIQGQSICLPNIIREKRHAVISHHSVIHDRSPIEQHQFPAFAELNFGFQAQFLQKSGNIRPSRIES
ncbi:hypothetical protein SDC9_132348 [bioreactor metagenome]|uniref:Uncharacterized protein n=1 Tax=bioreactor metagenome TaxID=1076179 RepID=A0A645D6X0_9ZZZZ